MASLGGLRRGVIEAAICLAVILAGANVNAAASGVSVKINVSLDAVSRDEVPAVFGYSGNIWQIPEVFDAGVAERILAMPRLGIARVSLGDQILSKIESIDQLQRALEHYPLNDFLRRFVAAGGQVLFSFDGVPRWISSDKSAAIKRPGPNQPIFRISPPSDYRAWSTVVETLVRHFNGRLGLNAYYESWNEPNYYYRGSADDYFKQYYYSVLGARRADAKALIGGPSLAEITDIGTAGAGQVSEAEKVVLLRQLLEQRFFFKQFLDYASRTPMPELGLKRIPVDFFSWHSYYTDPNEYYDIVVPLIRQALTAAGYSATTPLINSEWNIAAEPPYPEGNLNATEVDAAFVASTLIAMYSAGVDGQAFQSFVDPGTDGYFGGTFTRTGIPRANFNTFRLFSLLKGRRIGSATSDRWVKSVAFRDGDIVYVLASSMVPTHKMIASTLTIRDAVENAQFTVALAKAGLADDLVKGRGLPEPYAGQARALAKSKEARAQQYARKAVLWKNGIDMEISLLGMKRPPRKVTRYLIDSGHSNLYPDLERAERLLAERMADIRERSVNEKIARQLRNIGLPDAEIEQLRAEVRARGSLKSALASVAPAKREGVARIFSAAVSDIRNDYQAVLREIENWQSGRLHSEEIMWPASGLFRIKAAPYSVQLFVITL